MTRGKPAQRVARSRRLLGNCHLRDRCLLDRAAYLREHIVGIRPDEANRSNHDHQNNRQHDRIFRDILAALIIPELL